MILKCTFWIKKYVPLHVIIVKSSLKAKNIYTYVKDSRTVKGQTF